MKTRQWFFVFAAIFIASQDYILIKTWPEGSWAGLPLWLFYFVLVHAVFIYSIYRLSESRSSE